MEINYETFEKTLKEGNYADAFHILFRMIDNLDPDSIKADKKWTKVARRKSNNKEIKTIENEFKGLPREKKKDIESKYEEILNNANRNTRQK